MENKEDIYLTAISKIISLTRDDKLIWKAIPPSEVPKKSDSDIIESAYITKYKNKLLRIYKRRYKGKTMAGQLNVLLNPTNLSTDWRWYYEIILDLPDEEGNSLWEFPKEEILEDLLRTIKFKTSGADQLIKELLAND